jgi:atypical dual specificity phosphatase
MTRIWERLFVGSLIDVERLVRQNANNIGVVITLCEQCVEDKTADVRYVQLPIEDDEPIPVRQFNTIMDAIALNIRRGNVLIHCAVGLSRSPTLTAAYMHRVGYKNFDAAIAEIERLRPIISPSKILMKSVKELL